ncbi:MAG: cytochrome b6-f complex subunit PetM [Synechococcus sp. SB0662_bin_45]|nr:cytochrome b6-f complex subunit PetM [Cyanobacteria bacterium MAG IRC3_bin_20]MDE0648653.1 cytochrome b6-f complex subunit PetM [Cyanobacteria bacterium MAG IRC4_bin_6]MXW13036.1 cytochrome b6-f complex subunit PetM [Synechococcus sp. SB0668_bin_13]MXX08575.1 cytochrome b6-f complex subunit PetM [Synechococcus sp. SB0667_bin_8]MYE21977.1 cytochrome b6-f complex subunit PetM [Synechococcus sp. SB0662_bin_45]MYG64242.1 cytochrome b6-f complex subunit PetM [Synechococcus sp. SB0675_bin_7]MYI7
MAGEIFGTAALFWLLIPVGLFGGLVVLKFQGDNFEN